MEDFINAANMLSDLIPIFPIFRSFIIVLGFTYIAGRISFQTKTPIGKNRVALITALICAIQEASMLQDKPFFPVDVWRGISIFAGACILYVLIGMRLAPRVDHMLDKKLSDDGVPHYDSEGIWRVPKKKKGKTDEA